MSADAQQVSKTDHVWHGVLAVDGLELLDLLADEGHDADAAEDMLTAQTWSEDKKWLRGFREHFAFNEWAIF